MSALYQRVYIPLGDNVSLYGFVRLVEGVPEHTHCCSLTPSVYVDAIGWDCDEAEDEEEAREECQGNW